MADQAPSTEGAAEELHPGRLLVPRPGGAKREFNTPLGRFPRLPPPQQGKQETLHACPTTATLTHSLSADSQSPAATPQPQSLFSEGSPGPLTTFLFFLFRQGKQENPTLPTHCQRSREGWTGVPGQSAAP